MLASAVYLIAGIINIYILCVIAWAIAATLISFNIVNRHQPFMAKTMYVLDRLVQPALRPIQRILPDLGGFDLSPILLIFLLTFLQQFVYGLLDARYSYIAFINLISGLLMLYIWCVGIYAVMGLLINLKLVNPFHTLVQIVMTILRKLCNAPVSRLRRIIPPVGKVDLAPFALLLLLLIANRLLLQIMFV